MRMAFGKAGIGNPDKFAVFPQIVHSLCTAVSHAAAKTSNHLEDGVSKGSLVRDTAFHAFRYELLCAFLEITVLGTDSHGTQTAHAAVYLEGTALVNLHGTRRFLRTGQQASEHDTAAAGCNCFCNITGVLDTAVGDNADSVI